MLAVLGAAALVATVTTLAAVRRSRPAPPPQCSVTSGGQTYSFSPEQAQNAAIIAAVAFKKGMPDHAVTIALAAALQESRLQNLPYGDLDSVGLFQQRPSQGWGAKAQLLDPEYAAAAFYDGLARIPGWESMQVTDAAQAVQQSAAPDAYAAWEGQARVMAVTLTGEAPVALACRFSHYGGAAPPPAALRQAMVTEMGTDLLDAAVSPKTGRMVASWAVAHAYSYHLASVSFAGLTWRPGRGVWAVSGAPSDSRVVTVSEA
jgi:hypothetical protein